MVPKKRSMRRITSGRLARLDGGADLVGEGGEGRAVLRAVGGVAAHGGGEVLVAEVEDGEADLLVLLGDAGAQMGAADGDLAAAGGEALVRVAVQVEAEELAVLRVAAEDGADGIVRAHLVEADAQSGDEAAVDVWRRRPSRGGWIWRGRESPGSASSSAAPAGPKSLAGELQHAAGVGDDLDGLDAGDLIEEPAATGVHELGVAFELEQFEQGDALFGREDVGGVPVRRSGRLEAAERSRTMSM